MIVGRETVLKFAALLRQLVKFADVNGKISKRIFGVVASGILCVGQAPINQSINQANSIHMTREGRLTMRWESMASPASSCRFVASLSGSEPGEDDLTDSCRLLTMAANEPLPIKNTTISTNCCLLTANDDAITTNKCIVMMMTATEVIMVMMIMK